MTVSLDGSPYSLEDTGRWVFDKAKKLQDRVDLLREQGQLSEQTLKHYFGETRFRQIAESNAIEGSTLDVGETQNGSAQGCHHYRTRPCLFGGCHQPLEGAREDGRSRPRTDHPPTLTR